MKSLSVLISMLSFAVFAAEVGSVPSPLSPEVKVVSTMNSGGYTYVEYSEGGAKKWLAGPETKVSVGDSIEYTGAMPMTNFTSKTLNRTFETINFVTAIKVLGGPAAGAAAAASATGAAPSGKPIKVAKAEKGLSVEECYSKKDTYKDKVISVRGKIVKLNANIMGKNWLHIQDGTGKEGSNDLVVTAESVGNAKMDSVVTVTGKLSTEKNLGSGYFFPVIIEDATVEMKSGKKKK